MLKSIRFEWIFLLYLTIKQTLMKNILCLFFISSLISCADDDFLRSDLERTRNNQVAEIPLDGLKLKSKGGLYSYSYFYNTNGFVDSIIWFNNWQGDSEGQKNFYDNLNRIVAKKSYKIIPQAPKYNTTDITSYKYNSINQIISSLTYDKDSVAIAYNTYSYNKDGSLFDPSIKIENGNIVKEGSVTYEFDNTPNPLYTIYPKAYRILNHVNKNNITLTKYSNDYFHVHTLKYNDKGYIIEEKISNMPTDTNDHIGYTYY